jgi:hypothetical protein
MLAISLRSVRDQFRSVSVPNGGAAVVTAPSSSPLPVYSQLIAVKLAGSSGSYSASGYIIDGVLPPMRQVAGAEVVLDTYTTDSTATWHIRGILPGESIGEWSWTDLQTLSATTYNGCVATVTGLVLDMAGTGSDARTTEMIAKNGRWVYRNGTQLLRRMLTAPAATSSLTEVIAQSVQFPVGLLQAGDNILVRYGVNRVGINGATTTFRWRFGTAGTTADTQLETHNQSTTQLSSGGIVPFRIVTDTAIAIQGSGNDYMPMGGTNTLAINSLAGVAVSDVNATATFFSVGLFVANALDTEQLNFFELTHEMSA